MVFPEKLLATVGSERAKPSISWGLGPSALFSNNKESTAKNLDFGVGEKDCLGSDLFYFPIEKTILIKNLLGLS